MTFIYEDDPYSLKMYPQAKNELSSFYIRFILKVIVLQTDIHTCQCRIKGVLGARYLREVEKKLVNLADMPRQKYIRIYT